MDPACGAYGGLQCNHGRESPHPRRSAVQPRPVDGVVMSKRSESETKADASETFMCLNFNVALQARVSIACLGLPVALAALSYPILSLVLLDVLQLSAAAFYIGAPIELS